MWNIKQKILPICKTYIFVSLMACLMAGFRFIQTENIRYLFYISNLLLAWIPFMCSIFIMYIYNNTKTNKKRSIILCLGLFVWLIFYPNAPYIITDFIHISVYNYGFKVKDTLDFQTNFWIWYDFIAIALFVWLGLMLGFISLRINQLIVMDKYNKVKSWIFVIMISFLSGYGIYLGRFVRWNSWDIIINPLRLIKFVIDDLKVESINFAFIFGVFLLLSYIITWKPSSLVDY